MQVYNPRGSISAERFDYESTRSLQRIRLALESHLKCNGEDPVKNGSSHSLPKAFEQRLVRHWSDLFKLLYHLYGYRYDFHFHLEQIVLSAYRSYLDRPEALLTLDEKRNHDPLWFRSGNMLGGALYVDLFAEDLKGLKAKIPYLKEMGFTYIHLMPLFRAPEGENDGGYAVSDYREVNANLGTVDELKDLADAFREVGISLVVDFVFNHTADDHQWARSAQSGDIQFQDYYYMFPSREDPDRYDRTVREIFPTVRRGSFSWHNGVGRWIWTTFNDYQWDLKYANPDVFRSMMEEMLFLSNLGVEILRLDAVAFIWKEEGTSCENLPAAHLLIRAFNKIAQIAAPSLLFKSEAIVHPDEVTKYISKDECQLSYNPLLMATIWESIATRDSTLLKKSIEHRHQLPEGCSWCNYLRGHDDIGWTFDDADARALGIDAYGHRRFLNDFYTGSFVGSFAKGVPFQFNPTTGDMRVCGTLASLAGVEQAIELDDGLLAENAIRRICVMHSVILTIGGIPLLFLGDEWGMLNDYRFREDEKKAGDSRWIHRVRTDWIAVDSGDGSHAYAKEIHFRLSRLLAKRKEIEAFSGVEMVLLETGVSEVLSYVREHRGDRVVVIQNLSDRVVEIDGATLAAAGPGHYYVELITGKELKITNSVELEAYEHLWLRRN